MGHHETKRSVNNIVL